MPDRLKELREQLKDRDVTLVEVMASQACPAGIGRAIKLFPGRTSLTVREIVGGLPMCHAAWVLDRVLRAESTAALAARSYDELGVSYLPNCDPPSCWRDVAVDVDFSIRTNYMRQITFRELVRRAAGEGGE